MSTIEPNALVGIVYATLVDACKSMLTAAIVDRVSAATKTVTKPIIAAATMSAFGVLILILRT